LTTIGKPNNVLTSVWYQSKVILFMLKLLGSRGFFVSGFVVCMGHR